jgi:hypothetical protein
MSECNDFFFGEYFKNGENVSLSLGQVAKKNVEPAFFTRQVNRFLEKNSNKFTLSDDTSMPMFREFIKNIEPDMVGSVVIYARFDVNDSVDATLACDIMFDQGIVSVVTNWCAYKESRADEIISSLLMPLHLSGLYKKSFISKPNTLVKLVEDSSDIRGFIRELALILDLAKYPSVYEGTDKVSYHSNSLMNSSY